MRPAPYVLSKAGIWGKEAKGSGGASVLLTGVDIEELDVGVATSHRLLAGVRWFQWKSGGQVGGWVDLLNRSLEVTRPSKFGCILALQGSDTYIF